MPSWLSRPRPFVSLGLLFFIGRAEELWPALWPQAMPFLWLIARGLINNCAIRGSVAAPRGHAALPLLVAWNIVLVIEPRFITGFVVTLIFGAAGRETRRAGRCASRADFCQRSSGIPHADSWAGSTRPTCPMVIFLIFAY